MYCDLSEINEGFKFEGKHTSEFNLSLLERIADPPKEKEIIEDIPFMQGVLDFSAILGQRVYENRDLTYRLKAINYSYENRKILETKLSNWLMKPSHVKLYDDFSRGYHYLAKCKSIEYIDSYEGLEVLISFDAYPFKIGEFIEGNDLWDPFNFELDVAQNTKFAVNGSKSITLINAGTNIVSPRIVASSQFEVISNGKTYIVPSGISESSEFTLQIGNNEMLIKGTGTIDFQFRKELL